MAGPNLEEKNDEGETALMRACVFGKIKVVAMLLAHGAELETTDVLGTTALMLACANVGRVCFSVVVCSFVSLLVSLLFFVINDCDQAPCPDYHISVSLSSLNDILSLVSLI